MAHRLDTCCVWQTFIAFAGVWPCGHSVILFRDTRYSQNLVRFANGADVIVHEVAAANEDSLKNTALIKQILGFHSSPEDAGRVFQQVQPKLAVYSHIVLLTSDPAVPRQQQATCYAVHKNYIKVQYKWEKTC